MSRRASPPAAVPPTRLLADRVEAALGLLRQGAKEAAIPRRELTDVELVARELRKHGR